MLIVSRRPGEDLCIGDDVVVAVLGIRAGQVRIGVQAPKHVAVDRREIRERKLKEGVAASQDCPCGGFYLDGKLVHGPKCDRV